MSSSPTTEQVTEALRAVIDPELRQNIVEPVSYTHLTLPTILRV